MKIPFNRPFIVGKELYNIAQAVMQGQLAGDGRFTKECQQWFEDQYGTKKALLTHSCTAALEMAALLLDIKPGDEVIMPSFTFVSTANAFVLRGGIPVWCDIESNTLNIDVERIEGLITSRTKAVVPVHYAGVGCDMDRIMALAERHDLYVVEDAAQAVNSKYQGQNLGAIGHLGAYSFHETKNFIAGEGGALLINDDRFLERAEIVREKGTDRSKFFRGEVDKYTWVDVGSSFLPSELVAAFLLAQLDEVDLITRKRKLIWNAYYEELLSLQENGCIRLPAVPDTCEHNGHIFYLIAQCEDDRNRLIAYLKQEHSIHSVFHYIPLHSSPMGKTCGALRSDLPVTVDMSSRIVRLPCFYELDLEDVRRICSAVKAYYSR